MKLLKLVPDNTNFDFMKWRNIALILSIVATVGSLVLVGVRGLNLGIGIITSVFTAVNLTRMLVALWVRRARPKELHI